MNRWTIRRQLSAFIAAICVLAVVGQVIFTQLSFRKGFASYVEELNRPRLESIAGRLAEHYDETLGWELVANDRRLWGDIAVNPRGSPVGQIDSRERPWQPGSNMPIGGDYAPRVQPVEEFTLPQELSTDVSRGVLPPGVLPEGLRPGPPPPRQDLPLSAPGPELTLTDAERVFVVGNPAFLDDAEAIDVPILVSGSIVGYLVSPGGMRIGSAVDDAFSEKLLQQSAYIGICVALISLLGAIVIAKQFSQPVVRLNKGTDELMQGNYDHEIPTDGPLEFGLLEQKFNRLSKTLAANRATQQHWISNISHELRTPLAILQAELDALDAGIREFGPDRLGSLTEEARRLGRLIDDLFLLSRADAGDLSYQFSEINLNELVQDLADGFQEKVRQAELGLEVLVPSKQVKITADADRLRQLFGNLINNCCAYTDKGGLIRIRLFSDRAKTYVEIEDSAPGVPRDECEKIFDRLYRVEKSRNRSEGGSGLGLAICRAIAEAHGAEIEALDSDIGGLRIRVSFS